MQQPQRPTCRGGRRDGHRRRRDGRDRRGRRQRRRHRGERAAGGGSSVGAGGSGGGAASDSGGSAGETKASGCRCRAAGADDAGDPADAGLALGALLVLRRRRGRGAERATSNAVALGGEPGTAAADTERRRVYDGVCHLDVDSDLPGTSPRATCPGCGTTGEKTAFFHSGRGADLRRPRHVMVSGLERDASITAPRLAKRQDRHVDGEDAGAARVAEGGADDRPHPVGVAGISSAGRWRCTGRPRGVVRRRTPRRPRRRRCRTWCSRW